MARNQSKLNGSEDAKPDAKAGVPTARFDGSHIESAYSGTEYDGLHNQLARESASHQLRRGATVKPIPS